MGRASSQELASQLNIDTPTDRVSLRELARRVLTHSAPTVSPHSSSLAIAKCYSVTLLHHGSSLAKVSNIDPFTDSVAPLEFGLLVFKMTRLRTVFPHESWPMISRSSLPVAAPRLSKDSLYSHAFCPRF